MEEQVSCHRLSFPRMRLQSTPKLQGYPIVTLLPADSLWFCSLVRDASLGCVDDGPRHSARGHEETQIRSALLRLPDPTRRGVRGMMILCGTRVVCMLENHGINLDVPASATLLHPC